MLQYEFPERLPSPVEMNTPNERILIHKGLFILTSENVSLTVDGKMEFTWFPTPKVIFCGDVIDGANLSDWYKMIEFTLSIDGNQFGHASIRRRTFGNEKRTKLEGSCLAGFVGERTVQTDKVSFAIPNLRDFLGFPVIDKEGERIMTDSACLQLEDPDFIVTIHKSKNYKADHKKLEADGGYILLYAGEVRKKNRAAISLDELQIFYERFNHFLFFINGSRTAAYFSSAIQEGKVLWTDYTGYHVDDYQVVSSWANIVSKPSFEKIWNMFTQLWKDKNDRDFLQTAIHWYVEANRQSGYVEGAIITAQTALELIFNWLIVEKRRLVRAQDAKRMPAADKIRQILAALNISSQIPSTLQDLLTLQQNADGPEVFVSIRNALVHGNETKRIRLMLTSLNAKYEALQMAIWYIELSLLFILKHDGNYNNRVSGKLWKDSGEKVPWA